MSVKQIAGLYTNCILIELGLLDIQNLLYCFPVQASLDFASSDPCFNQI